MRLCFRSLHRPRINGLLRQYFPKGTDLSVHTEAHLDAVADELNDRPRKRLQFKKPIEMIGPLLLRSPPESAEPSAERCKVASWMCLPEE